MHHDWMLVFQQELGKSVVCASPQVMECALSLCSGFIAENSPDDVEALLSLAASLDSADMRDRVLPLRLTHYRDRGKRVSGDPGVQISLVKALLRAFFPSPQKAYDALCHCLQKGGEGYFLLLVLAAVALDMNAHEDCERYLRELMRLQTDCVFASRINSALVGASSGRHGMVAAGRDLSDKLCLHPFNTVMTVNTSSSPPAYGLRMCDCPSLLPYNLDDDDAWNGITAREIRRSILDGDYSYCTRASCYHILQDTLPRKAEISDPISGK